MPTPSRNQSAETDNREKRRAADVAYDRIETLISKLEIAPGSPVVEAELAELTGLGRTPVREALVRMVSMGLVLQQPRRGLIVSTIDVMDHLDVLATRRVLERLIAANAARRATDAQRKALIACAQKMVKAAQRGNLDEYMAADQALDHVNHAACRNRSAVKAVIPLIVQCRRFWYAYQHEGEIAEGAQAHLVMAQAIASGNEAEAADGAERLMDYLERFARRVVNA
ncbi:MULTISPECIES: GntR family transcriptional regulator [Cupriavidus]|uniref:GntR family transcriptional regulator n=1 Tax=Cupriavidus campinensis TaxID=151783 RepID=A0ABY3ENB0_9BURK|nr:GntR family transcriptional regulator [Cupriavidus campinensis]TSP12243.1 GntR family transcriptional regulator [Cupriavidus campinensis]